jgi:serine/threonine-protein kinase RsbW
MYQEIQAESADPERAKPDGAPVAAGRGPDGPALSTVALSTVALSIPADRDQVVLVRSVAAHIGVRLGLTVEELTDLRLAVDEACGVFLLSPDFGGLGEALDCRFEEVPGEDGAAGTLVVTVSAPVAATLGPDEDDIGWIMLGALVDELTWRTENGLGTVRLVKRLTGRES